MKYKNPDLKKFKTVLVAYPHPDDETFTVTGLVNSLDKHEAKCYLFLASKGEEGRPKTRSRDDTRKMRTIEAQRSADIIGFSKLIQEDFGDGQLERKKTLLKSYLKDLINKLNPDLLVTYDKSGLYGHPDHIALSEVITELANENHIRLWYSCMPENRFKYIKLPVFMAKDKNFLSNRAEPNIKINVSLLSLYRKLLSFYAHKSQHYSFKEHIRPLPLWVLVLFNWNEFFYEVGGHGGIRTRA